MFVKILWKSVMDFFRQDGPIYAGSITCFFMMSFIPFFLLIVSIFGYVLGENRAFYEFLMNRLAGFFPEVTREISDEIGKIITYRGIGLVTFGVHVYFSYQLYYAIERPITIIFRSEEKRRQLISLLLSLCVIALIIIFITLSFAVAAIVPVLDYLARYAPVPKIGQVTRIFIRFIVPVFLSFTTVSMLYMLIPQKKIRLKNACYGGLFTAVFLEVAKIAFAWYAIAKVAQLGNIYGSLTTVVIFLLWIFYAASILLIGAHVVRNLEGMGRANARG